VGSDIRGEDLKSEVGSGDPPGSTNLTPDQLGSITTSWHTVTTMPHHWHTHTHNLMKAVSNLKQIHIHRLQNTTNN